MTYTKLPSVAFQPTNAASSWFWEYFDRMFDTPTYHGFGSWDILENELYDFLYSD